MDAYPIFQSLLIYQTGTISIWWFARDSDHIIYIIQYHIIYHHI